MYQVEIAGHTYLYRNISQLHRLLEKKQESLVEEDAHFAERLLRVRNERKAIAISKSTRYS